jgi:hypothetical protein
MPVLVLPSPLSVLSSPLSVLVVAVVCSCRCRCLFLSLPLSVLVVAVVCSCRRRCLFLSLPLSVLAVILSAAKDPGTAHRTHTASTFQPGSTARPAKILSKGLSRNPLHPKHILIRKLLIHVLTPKNACQAPKRLISHKPKKIELPKGSTQSVLIEIDREKPRRTARGFSISLCKFFDMTILGVSHLE